MQQEMYTVLSLGTFVQATGKLGNVNVLRTGDLTGTFIIKLNSLVGDVRHSYTGTNGI